MMYLRHFYPSSLYLRFFLCLLLGPFTVGYAYVCVAYVCVCLGMVTWDWITNWSSSLAKTYSPSLSSQVFPGPLHLGMGPCEIFPTYTGMSTDVIIERVLFK